MADPIPPEVDQLAEIREYILVRLAQIEEERCRLEAAIRALGGVERVDRPRGRRKEPKVARGRRKATTRAATPRAQQAPRPKPKRGGKGR